MRFPSRRAPRLSLLAVCGFLAACDEPVTQEPLITANEGPQAMRMETSAGILLTRLEVNQGMARMAQGVALALAEPGIRKRVHAALRASPFRENKLQFRALLQSDTIGLLKGVAVATNRREQEVIAALDSVVELEFYMPVKEHWGRWRGGEDLLVASFPDDDGTIPRGFDLEGREVPLSAETPPETPTLVLTGVETNFHAEPVTQPAQTHEDEGVFVPMTHYADSAIFMTYARIPDTHEGWGMGDPEFEIHTYLEHTDAIYYDDICSGANRPVPYYWDMNSSTWSGDVMVATQAFIGETHVQHQMWEDDNTACGSSGGRPPKDEGTVTRDKLYNWASAIVDVFLAEQPKDPATTVAWIKAAYNALGATYDLASGTLSDDFVGIMDGPVNGCWPAEGDARFELRATDGGASQGHVRLLYTYGERDPVCPLDVDIDGPAVVYSCEEGESSVDPTYDAIVFSGTGTTYYEWREDGALQSGTGPSYTLQDLSVGTRRLGVIVTRGGEQASDEIFVDVQDGGETGCNA